MLSELARRHPVTLVTTHGPADDPDGLRQALAHCEQVISVPLLVPKQGSAGFARALARSWFSALPVDLWKWRSAEVRRAAADVASKGTDVVVADFLVGMPNAPLESGVPVVHFSHNVEHQIWRRLASVERWGVRRALLELEWRKMRRAEKQACEEAALTVAVSGDDRDRLAADAPGATVLDVPTGVDTRYFVPEAAAERPGRLVFSGSMDWYPNEDAMLYFVSEILPLIRRERPDVSVVVVGRQPSARLREAAEEAGVTVTGTVPDVRPHLAAGEVFVVPLRVGGGTRLKIFEAMAAGKAVVSTRVGAEGLDVEDGRHLVLADGPEAFSRAVLDLLRDAPRRRAIAEAGRAIVEERYSWTQVTRVFEKHLERACQRP
jgi:glycosyltransferase involved in cell wall biosynthesis